MTNTSGLKGILSGRSKLLFVAAVVVVGLAALAVWLLLPFGNGRFTSRHEVSVKGAELLSSDRLVLEVNTNTCKRNPEAYLLRETDVDVQVKVVVDPDPFPLGGPQCLEAPIVKLQEPLGDRIVIDAHTGRVVSVTPVATATPRTSRQEQAESPPTESVPPDVRSTFSDAELQDLQAVADQKGTSLQEAIDRYGWQNDFSFAVSRIREAAPKSFAGAVIVDGSHAWVAFTGTPPKAALDIIKTFTSSHSGISVEVRTNQSLTEAELEEAISAVHDAVRKAPEVLDILTGFDPKTAQIESTVVLKNTAPDSVVDDLLAIAEKRLVEVTREDILDSISISVTRSKIPVIVIKE